MIPVLWNQTEVATLKLVSVTIFTSKTKAKRAKLKWTNDNHNDMTLKPVQNVL